MTHATPCDDVHAMLAAFREPCPWCRINELEAELAGLQMSQAIKDATITLPDGTVAVPIEHHRECHHKLKEALAALAKERERADGLTLLVENSVIDRMLDEEKKALLHRVVSLRDETLSHDEAARDLYAERDRWKKLYFEAAETYAKEIRLTEAAEAGLARIRTMGIEEYARTEVAKAGRKAIEAAEAEVARLRDLVKRSADAFGYNATHPGIPVELQRILFEAQRGLVAALKEAK